MFIPVSFLLVSLTSLLTITSTPSILTDAFSIGVTQQQQRKQKWQQQSLTAASTSTSLNVVPVDIDLFTTITTSTTTTMSPNTLHAVAQSLWIATIDSDIANIQLEEFRKVFAGGIAVMAGGLISTIGVGVILEKNDLYASLAAESYLDMANDDPDFWKKMTEGLSEEEKTKAEEIMKKIKQQKEGSDESENGSASVVVDSNTNREQHDQVAKSQGEGEARSEKEIAKASNDMFSDY